MAVLVWPSPSSLLYRKKPNCREEPLVRSISLTSLQLWEEVALITRATKQRTRVEREGEGMLMCWVGAEEGTAGCLFTVLRVQQLFQNKKSHQRKELFAQLLCEFFFNPDKAVLIPVRMDFVKTPCSRELVKFASVFTLRCQSN